MGESRIATVERLALAKAEASVGQLLLSRQTQSVETRALVVGADTVVIDGNRLLGKPSDPANAVALLTSMRGRTHQVMTGVAIVDSATGVTVTRSEVTDVHLRPLSDDEIQRYVASGDPLDKAGAYAIQNEQYQPVDRIAGCYSNVVGLPLCVLADMLIDRGVDVAREWRKTNAPCSCAEKLGIMGY